MTLDQLPVNQPAKIQRLAKTGLTSKLVEMGLYPGKDIKVIFKAPLGDPLAIDVDGYTLSLRKSEASQIEID
ncbi:FeoA family protein [Marinoscillum sp. MHG1-6]|uniref:FeoA family protein n=1 Tax=Marinoscillum sp. MHG1-6 TaxID=2959627 RepID=UPI00215767BD|nr:FeoA family protein [Marinoscillum sp. MHG1-6]